MKEKEKENEETKLKALQMDKKWYRGCFLIALIPFVYVLLFVWFDYYHVWGHESYDYSNNQIEHRKSYSYNGSGIYPYLYLVCKPLIEIKYSSPRTVISNDDKFWNAFNNFNKVISQEYPITAKTELHFNKIEKGYEVFISEDKEDCMYLIINETGDQILEVRGDYRNNIINSKK